jgi:alkyl sulfatase BDS1-like metallo-beta-lactamase superfamily hydrolase
LLLIVVVVLALAVTPDHAAAYTPEGVDVQPTLMTNFKEYFPPKVLPVTEGIWVARGYNRDNPVLIEGVNGLIVVDPGESVAAAQIVKAAFNASLDNLFDKKPVKAIVYTHHHDCHIHGASVFADEHTEIIAHEHLMSALYDEWFGQVFPSRAEGGLKMSGALFMNAPVVKLVGENLEEVPGWFAGMTLAGRMHFGALGFLPPTKTIGEETTLSIAGVSVTLISVAGETQDVLLVWLPRQKVLIQIAVLYEAFPALTTMRGSRVRDPLDYVRALKIARSLNPEYLVTIHGPNPVTVGAEEIRQYLTNFSDAIQFLNDQTVQYLNRGYTAGEIMDLIELPDHLANSPYLQETYGLKDWDIFHIFRYYRGFYTGEVRDLFPQSTLSEARMSAELAGGIDELAGKAQSALADNPEWALRFADDVLVLDPDHTAAFETKKAAMISLAAGTMNSQARNMLLSDYLLMTGQVQTPFTFGDPKAAFARIDDVAVPMMPLDTLHRILAVNLNASKSIDTDMVVGLQLTDTHKNKPDHYTLQVRKGILEVNPPSSSDAQFVIVTDTLTWKKLVLNKFALTDAVEDAKVVIPGGTPEDFYAFMDLFDFGVGSTMVSTGSGALEEAGGPFQQHPLYLPMMSAD